jgi:DNA-binding FadR family transcriptional regulator
MLEKPVAPVRVVKRRPPLHRAAQEEIKAYIIQMGLEPGDPLPPEGELARQFNISRNSVREAVKSLEALGILEARPGSGLFVKQFSFDSILDNLGYSILFDLKPLEDILEVRSHIEYGMVQRVIQSVTPDQIAALEEILVRMREAALEQRYSAEDDRAFHQALYSNVENTLVQRIVDIFWMAFHQVQERSSIPGPANPVETYQRHAEIVDALKARDVEAMRVVMLRHFTGIRNRLRSFEARRAAPSPSGV